MRMRNANTDDAAALREMWCRFMMELHAGSHPSVQDTEVWETRLQSQLRREQVVVADDGQSLQGFAGFIEHSHRPFVPAAVALLVDLYVTPAYRGQAIATVLLRRAMQQAVEHGCERVWTNTEESNRPAQRCLEGTGFQMLTGFDIPGLTDQKYYQMELRGERAEPEGGGYRR